VGISKDIGRYAESEYLLGFHFLLLLLSNPHITNAKVVCQLPTTLHTPMVKCRKGV
jgi:hypothetical protein